MGYLFGGIIRRAMPYTIPKKLIDKNISVYWMLKYVKTSHLKEMIMASANSRLYKFIIVYVDSSILVE